MENMIINLGMLKSAKDDIILALAEKGVDAEGKSWSQLGAEIDKIEISSSPALTPEEQQWLVEKDSLTEQLNALKSTIQGKFDINTSNLTWEEIGRELEMYYIPEGIDDPDINIVNGITRYYLQNKEKNFIIFCDNKNVYKIQNGQSTLIYENFEIYLGGNNSGYFIEDSFGNIYCGSITTKGILVIKSDGTCSINSVTTSGTSTYFRFIIDNAGYVYGWTNYTPGLFKYYNGNYIETLMPGLSSLCINTVTSSDGSLYVSPQNTSDGVYKIKDGNITKISGTTYGSCSIIHEDSDGNIYLASTSSSCVLYKITNDSATVLYNGFNYYGFIEDNNGNVYFGSTWSGSNGGILYYNKTTDETTQISTETYPNFIKDNIGTIFSYGISSVTKIPIKIEDGTITELTSITGLNSPSIFGYLINQKEFSNKNTSFPLFHKYFDVDGYIVLIAGGIYGISNGQIRYFGTGSGISNSYTGQINDVVAVKCVSSDISRILVYSPYQCEKVYNINPINNTLVQIKTFTNFSGCKMGFILQKMILYVYNQGYDNLNVYNPINCYYDNIINASTNTIYKDKLCQYSFVLNDYQYYYNNKTHILYKHKSRINNGNPIKVLENLPEMELINTYNTTNGTFYIKNDSVVYIALKDKGIMKLENDSYTILYPEYNFKLCNYKSNCFKSTDGYIYNCDKDKLYKSKLIVNYIF